MNAEIEERVRRRERQRLAAGLALADDGPLYVEEAKAVVAAQLGERTAALAVEACGDEETYVVSVCIVNKAHERSVTLAQYRDNMCSVYGHKDFLCSANAVVEKGVEVYVGVSRQLWNSAMAFTTGYPNAVPFDIGNRLCDAQRYFGAQASLLASFLPVQDNMRKAIAKVLFFSLEWQVEAPSPSVAFSASSLLLSAPRNPSTHPKSRSSSIPAAPNVMPLITEAMAFSTLCSTKQIDPTILDKNSPTGPRLCSNTDMSCITIRGMSVLKCAMNCRTFDTNGPI